MHTFSIYSLLISAGLSSRMNGFKPLLEDRGHSFLCQILVKLSLVSQKVIVVTGHREKEILTEIESIKNYDMDIILNDGTLVPRDYFKTFAKKLIMVYNDNYSNGMFTSLQKGLKEANECEWLLYHFVDQPGLPLHFYREFIAQIENQYDWIQPLWNNQKGHPLLLNKQIFSNILEMPEDFSLRDFDTTYQPNKKLWHTSKEHVTIDLDSTEDFNKYLDNKS